MRSPCSQLMLTVSGMAFCLSTTGCWKPWGDGKDHAAAAKPASEKEISSSAAVSAPAIDEPVKVVLLDSATHKELWVVNTTRSHIALIPDTGAIKIDGQLWEGSYKIVKR